MGEDGVLLRLAGNLLRLMMLSLFPLGSIAVMAGVVFVDQGQDVLRVLHEKSARGSQADLVVLLATSLTLSFSVWYSLRWLYAGDFPGLRLQLREDHWLLRWLPRLAGGLPQLLLAAALWPARRGQPTGWWTTVFAVAGVLVIGLLALRWTLLRATGMTSHTVRDWRRREHLPAETQTVLAASIVASFVCVGVFVMVPVDGPRIFGAAALVPLALASMNLFGSFLLFWWPLRRAWPPLLVAALAWALFSGFFNDNHAVRTVGDLPAAPDREPDWRPPLAQRFALWRQANGLGERAPYIVVASEGGGIRAAYWTAVLLEKLGARVDGFDAHVFALSGVSGGALGSASWVTALPGVRGDDPQAQCRATHSLKGDFLAPGIAGALFGDLLQRFWPKPVTALDRARAIELGWQQAYSRCDGQWMANTLRALYTGPRTRRDPRGLPSLLLNTTIVETGQRAVQTDLRPLREDGTALFDDAVDLQARRLSSAYQPLAGLVHNSARFPLVSPAGTVLEFRRDRETGAGAWKPKYRVVDGGYFDNSGATTAVDLMRGLERGAAAGAPAILLVVRNDPSARPLCRRLPCGRPVARDATRTQAQTELNAAPAPAATDEGVAPGCAWPRRERIKPGRVLPETSSILLGLYNARSAHARLADFAALREAADRSDGSDARWIVFDLAFCMPQDEYAAKAPEFDVEPPLGWILSEASRSTMDRAADQLVDRIAAPLATALATVPLAASATPATGVAP